MALLLRVFLGTVLAAAACLAQAAKLPKLVLAGPYAGVSNPLIHMVETGALSDVAEKVEFVAWRDPDQLRLLALEGKADFLAMPTNVAANLYNRGARLALLNVSTWGVLWVVSRDPALKTLADLRGKEVVIPFRADMPDIVFGALAAKQGLDPRKEVRVRYVATPMDAMQLLLTRRAEHALLAEPAVSMVLRKSSSFPISALAPGLHRGVDLQQEWARSFKGGASIPQAGVAVMGEAGTMPAVVARFRQAYAASHQWCAQHADACGRLVARHARMLSPEAVADAIKSAPQRLADAEQARPELEQFYRLLLERQPALVGGRLPGPGFYQATPRSP